MSKRKVKSDSNYWKEYSLKTSDEFMSEKNKRLMLYKKICRLLDNPEIPKEIKAELLGDIRVKKLLSEFAKEG